MFFIIGNPRSGTSLFRLLLTSHSEIHIPPECGFMVWWKKKYGDWSWQSCETIVEQFLDDLFAAKKIEFWNLSRDALLSEILHKQPDSYAALCSTIYKFHARKNSKGNSKIGDKNNFHLNHILELGELYTDAKFIHIIRDGRDVATSYMEMSKIDSASSYRPRLPSDTTGIAREWRENIHSVRQGLEKLSDHRKLEIRYEDLVRDSQATLTKVCHHLNVLYEPQMLEFYQSNQAKKLEPDEFMAWKARTRGKIDASAIGKWKKLSKTDIRTFEEVCGEILSDYNYELAGTI